MSDWVQVTSGVPQGSILGPLLFLICMNDIGSDISSSRRLLTDDCTIYREVRNTVNAELLQQDLYKLYHWTQTWQLKLNPTKSKIMQITNKRNHITFSYFLNNTELEWVDTFKFLGIELTSKLSWSAQTSEAKTKATRVLKLLRQTMH